MWTHWTFYHNTHISVHLSLFDYNFIILKLSYMQTNKQRNKQANAWSMKCIYNYQQQNIQNTNKHTHTQSIDYQAYYKVYININIWLVHEFNPENIQIYHCGKQMDRLYNFEKPETWTVSHLSANDCVGLGFLFQSKKNYIIGHWRPRKSINTSLIGIKTWSYTSCFADKTPAVKQLSLWDSLFTHHKTHGHAV